ncbi:16S rRNA (guanine(527)-N(7))-methyltransferase RsmG [Sphingomonas sp.]|uniref:16S rRNA (guanine(527)-N(7))-methyltransferase RsmG n=1 Tax=Sphingomonas sp. TaxID=28214 RepID=UPI003B00A340
MEHRIQVPADVTFIPSLPGSAEARLDELTKLLLSEAQRQNLIAESTIPQFRSRHINDSLQLLPLLAPGNVVDVGSGAGLPGLVLACTCERVFHLIEPRARRVAFLTQAIQHLELAHRVTVHRANVQRVGRLNASNIVARAVASLDTFLSITFHIAAPDARWVLPKGRSARMELEAAQQSWQGEFQLVGSATDPSASIVVASHIGRRRK